MHALNKKFKVAITSQIDEKGIMLLEREAEIVFPKKPSHLLTLRDILETGKDADALLVVNTVEQITKEVIVGSTKLRIIARYGVGYDNVDVKAASERGIYVTTTPVLDETVADQAFALLLCLARNICKGHNYMASRQWKVGNAHKFIGTDVWGKTTGIVGLGRIGSRIAERADGFKMRMLYHDIVRKRDLESKLGVEYKPLSELLRESDIIFISAPLNNVTHGMIDEKEFTLMKPSAFLINVARGPIVNHDALVKALHEGKIAGAGLDVFDREPVFLDDPLLTLDNVIVTPHIASNTIECRKRMATTAAEEILRVLHGEQPKYAVNLESLTGRARS